VYSISSKGGTEKRIMDVLGYDPVISPNGNLIAFVRGDINPVARQDYRGSSNRDIWLYDIKNKTYTKLPGFSTNDILPQWAGNNSLYFLSSDEGAYNLYKLKIDAGGKASGTPEKLTDFKNESIRSYNLSADGSSIVFEKEMDIYLLKTKGGAAKKINVVINADERFDATEQKTISTGAESFAISPNGKLIAYTTRG
jgi:tricorn protease-like protein